MILLNHGIFTFGNSAKESYDRAVTAWQEEVDKVEAGPVVEEVLLTEE